MALSPWQCGATLPVMPFQFQGDSGVATNLTGATLSLTIHNTQTGADVAGVGTWTITNATAGQATYTFAAADSEVAGLYDLYIIATYSAGDLPFNPIPWQVNSR